MNIQKFDKRQYLTVLSQNANCSLKQDARIEESVRRNLETEYAKLREEVHVTDLTLCMRQALYRKLQPVTPTLKQLGYFFDGARRHQALQQLYGAGVVEKEIDFEGVKATIDILESYGPIEFKTTRARSAISEHWIRQLAYYILATGSRYRILQIQRIMPGKQPKNGGATEEQNPFPAYVLELADEQKKFWLEDFLTRKGNFTRAFSSKDPSKAPIYRGDGNWLCQECAYRAECDRLEGFAK